MYILDIQASGMGEQSYPAEIAWRRIDGSESYSTLINLDNVHGWEKWSHDVVRHGLTRQECCDRGGTTAYVARRVDDLLKHYPVYSESPIQDQRWLDKLFRSAGKRCPAKLIPIEHAVPSRRRFELHRYLLARRDEHNAAANSLLLARAIQQINVTATPDKRKQSAISSPLKWLKGFSFVT